MADRLVRYNTSYLQKDQMGQAVDEMMQTSKDSRRKFERRWYDNCFFDDGHHFRYLSRTQNKIVDLSERRNIYSPMRAIPKASRQIRGVSNILTSLDLVPVIYPEKVNKEEFPDPDEYEFAKDLARTRAKRVGHWVSEEFENQMMDIRLALMIILAAKQGISYLQVWPDAVEERIKVQVYDAFDIFLMGQFNEIYDSPFIIKGIPKLISEIKADERFDEDQKEKINPDNRQASSEIKEAYVAARFGKDYQSNNSATLLLKEAYIKEYLNDDNETRIKLQENGGDILKKRKKGDPVIRQTFVAGNIWLRDEYLDIPDYPFVDYRFEPGNVHQTPLIERFIPANKSLDVAVSRIERYFHTMVVGTWLKRKGEQFNINNQAGGQIIEYAGTPPVQGDMANVPAFVFNFFELLNSFIEEQGVTTTALGKIPKGVKAWGAIESLKESEYSNLTIAIKMLKKTVKTAAEKFMDIADDYFVKPQTVYYLEKGEPQYFDVIGASNLKKRQKLEIETSEDVIPISKEYQVDIEVKSGMAFTSEGKKQAMQSLVQELRAYAAEGYINPEALKVVIEKYLESYQFGATSEFMEEIDKGEFFGGLSEKQVEAMKIAMAEVIKDTGLANVEQQVQATKVGVAEAAKDLQGGGANATNQRV